MNSNSSSSRNEKHPVPDEDESAFPGSLPWITQVLRSVNSLMEVATLEGLGGHDAEWVSALLDDSVSLPHVVPGFSVSNANSVLSLNYEEAVCPFALPSGNDLHRAVNAGIPEENRKDPLGIAAGGKGRNAGVPEKEEEGRSGATGIAAEGRVDDPDKSFYRLAALLSVGLRFSIPEVLQHQGQPEQREEGAHKDQGLILLFPSDGCKDISLFQVFYAMQYSNQRMLLEALDKYKALQNHFSVQKSGGLSKSAILKHLAFKIKVFVCDCMVLYKVMQLFVRGNLRPPLQQQRQAVATDVMGAAKSELARRECGKPQGQLPLSKNELKKVATEAPRDNSSFAVCVEQMLGQPVKAMIRAAREAGILSKVEGNAAGTGTEWLSAVQEVLVPQPQHSDLVRAKIVCNMCEAQPDRIMRSDVSTLLRGASVLFPKETVKELVEIFGKTSLQTQATWLCFIKPFFSKSCKGFRTLEMAFMNRNIEAMNTTVIPVVRTSQPAGKKPAREDLIDVGSLEQGLWKVFVARDTARTRLSPVAVAEITRMRLNALKAPWKEEEVCSRLRLICKEILDMHFLQVLEIHALVVETLHEPLEEPSLNGKSLCRRQACLLSLPTFLAALIDTEQAYLDYMVEVVKELEDLLNPKKDACTCCLLLPAGVVHRKECKQSARNAWVGCKAGPDLEGFRVHMVRNYVDKIGYLLKSSKELKATLHFVAEDCFGQDMALFSCFMRKQRQLSEERLGRDIGSREPNVPLHYDHLDLLFVKEISAITGKVLRGEIGIADLPCRVMQAFEKGGERLPEGLVLDRSKASIVGNALVMNICCTTRIALAEDVVEDSDVGSGGAGVGPEAGPEQRGPMQSKGSEASGSSSCSEDTLVYGILDGDEGPDKELRDLEELLQAAIQMEETRAAEGGADADGPCMEDVLRVRRLVREGSLPPRDGIVYEDTVECVMCFRTLPVGLLWGYAACGHMCFCDLCAQDMLELEEGSIACLTCRPEQNEKQVGPCLVPMWSKKGRALKKVFM